MAEQDWRIPALTRQDGEAIKVWQPRQMHYSDAEFAMKMFNERGVGSNLKNGIQSTQDVKLVMRNDGGSESYNSNVYRMLNERETIEAEGKEEEMERFLNEISNTV